MRRTNRSLPGIAGKLWTLPNTALGLGLGAVAVMLGARARIGRNAVEFLGQPLLQPFRITAITLGNTIHYAPGRGPEETVTRYDGTGPIVLGEHERAHTRQYERWGPLFLPVYFCCWFGKSGNRFEHAADDEASRAGGNEASRAGGNEASRAGGNEASRAGGNEASSCGAV